MMGFRVEPQTIEDEDDDRHEPGAYVINGHLFYRLGDGSVVRCTCMAQPYVSMIAEACSRARAERAADPEPEPETPELSEVVAEPEPEPVKAGSGFVTPPSVTLTSEFGEHEAAERE